MAKIFMSYQKFWGVVLSQKSLKFWILVAEMVTKWQKMFCGLKGLKAKRLGGLPPSVKDVNAFNVLGATAFCPTVSL